MNELLQKLVDNDTRINEFLTSSQVIQQGLAPLLSRKNKSIKLQKANLLEVVKFNNWQAKAKELFIKLQYNNIKFLVFKGFAYTYLLYNSSHLRPYSDIDIIINNNDYDQVSNIFTELGYQCYVSRQGKYISFQNSFYDNGTPNTVIDLHWQINNRREFHQHFPFEFLLQDAITVKFKDMSFLSPILTKSFIIACFHYHAHRPEDRKHIWLYDLALIWNQMLAKDKQSCFDIAKKTQQLTIVQNTIFQLDSVFPNCLNIIETNKINVDEATKSYFQKRTKKITDIKIKLQNIKGAKNKIKFLSEYVFQSTDYVQNRYQLKSKVWVLFYYPKMWVVDFLKLFK